MNEDNYVRYNVSALIVTYNPDYEKLIMTLCSFLLQEEVTLQIVIADDGSDNDYFFEAESYFKRKGFYNYKFIKNYNNVGTIKNIVSGLKECEGEYIKILSPGDYIAGGDILIRWVNYMRDEKLSVCGSDYICYEEDDSGRVKSSIQKMHPQISKLKGKYLSYNYILNNDIFLGAAVLCRTEEFSKYINMICGVVIYAEDNCYRIMAYCGERVGYFPVETIVYEIGTGISTSNKEKWLKLLSKDWDATNEIIKMLPIKDRKLKNNFLKISYIHKFHKRRYLKKLQVYISIRKLILLKIKIKLRQRFTSGILPTEWMKELNNVMNN